MVRHRLFTLAVLFGRFRWLDEVNHVFADTLIDAAVRRIYT